MKFLVVFVSVVVVVHSKVLTGEELNRVNTIELQPGAPEDLRGYIAEAEQQPGAYVGEGIQVFGAEEGQKVGFPLEAQRDYEVISPEAWQLEAEVMRAFADGIYIPILFGTCTTSVCTYICNILVFKNANCVSTRICQCTN